MQKSFTINYDAAKKNWVPSQMRVRMLSQTEDGQYEPCEFTDPEFTTEPAGWLVFNPKAEGEIICADVNVSDAFISEPGEEKYARPIEVFIKARPENASDEQQPISTNCQVQVEEPGVKLGFTVSPDECYKEGEVWLPADAKTICNLSVWVEEVDPVTQEVFRAPEEDFEFRVETTFEPELLLCLDLDKGIMPAESRWQTGKAMPDLKEPFRGEVKIKAFSKKKASDEPVGKLDIPWALFAAEIAVQKEIDPPLPAIPGRELAVTLKLRQQGLDAPLADTEVQFVWAEGSDATPLGTILTETAVTDAEGVVELRYAPPEELRYQAKKRLYDEIAVLIGKGEEPLRLDETIVIPVAPEIRLFGKAEKKGLLMDPEQQPIEILPEQITGGRISGNLILPIQMEGGPLKRFGVNFASLEIALEEDQPPVFNSSPQKQGLWNLEFKEIEEAFKKAKLETKPLRLSKELEDGQLFKMVLGETENETISHYEEELTSDRVAVFSKGFQRSLKYYRYHFCSQLAQKQDKDYDLAVAGVQLLWIAVRGTHMYLRRFKCHEDMVKSRVDKMVGTFINIALNALSASTKLREFGGWAGGKAKALIEWLTKTRFGRWIAKGASWFGSFASSISKKALNQICPMVKKVQSGVMSLLNKLGAVGQKIYNSIGSLLDDLVGLIDDLANALCKKVQAFQEMLSNSSEHWDDLVAWVNQKKDSIKQGAGELAGKASSWVSKFVSAFQEMVESLLNLVGNLFEKMGALLFKCLTGILSWCGKKAKDWLKPMFDWLMEHSETTKKAVEEILDAEFTREGASEYGIEKLIDAGFNELFGMLISCKPAEVSKDAVMRKAGFTLALMGRQPEKVVGYVYKNSVKQYMPADWESERHEFIEKMVDASSRYHDYELTTSTIDEVADILNTIISVGALGIALFGVVFSGGTGIAMAAQAITTIEAAFNLAKAALCDIPQVSLAVILMFILVAKYDLLICDLCFKNTGTSSA
ncbi:MAG: hypothetical protein PWR01_3011 [Clostridiales bacterium]|nr:hypothetical protein [Clostridiales bacterium]MDN5281938.1 hypothetical protein [Candidatus Ozemobacter sp.]